MKANRKRFLAAFLACLLLFCEIPMQVSAEEISESALTELEETGQITEENVNLEASEGYRDGFSYEQEFEDRGLKVSLYADEGVVPKDAGVSITLIDSASLENLTEEIQGKMEDITQQRCSSESTGTRTIFDMYYDLQASVDQIYALDFEINYSDAEGNLCVFEPEGGQSIKVSMEIDGLGDLVSDEMQEAALFYAPDVYGTGNGRRSGTAGEVELLSENIDANGDEITFQAGHFSIYTVAIIRYAASASEKMEAAQEKAWKIINTYADPEYFLEDPLRNEMTDIQYEKLHQAALNATAGCTTPYEKIKAITAFVADRTYYDYKYLEDKINNPTYFKPYEVYVKKRTVCAGFARLQRTLLTSIGIPCMDLFGENHEYNAAYDSINKRWIFSDATWCSNNKYTKDGERIKGGFSYARFDLTPRQIAELTSHEVYFAEGLLDGKENSAYYRLETKGISDKDYSKIVWSDRDWYLCVSGAKKDRAKAVSKFAGFKVLDVPDFAFAESSIKSIDLSSTGIVNIGYAAFCKCGELRSVKLPPNLTKLRDHTFYKCRKLEKVKFPKKLKEIGKWAFFGCKKLKQINLYETKTAKIGYAAFYDCKAASAIKLPSSLKIVKEFAFGCNVKKAVKTTAVTSLSAKKIGITDKKKAIWAGREVNIRPYSYKIKFVANHKSATGKMKTVSCTYGKKKKLSANQFKVKGYKFAGWNTKKNGKGKNYKNQEKVKNLTAKAGGTVKLYAQWKKKGE